MPAERKSCGALFAAWLQHDPLIAEQILIHPLRLELHHFPADKRLD
jgi:hypothetical protein